MKLFATILPAGLAALLLAGSLFAQDQGTAKKEAPKTNKDSKGEAGDTATKKGDPKSDKPDEKEAKPDIVDPQADAMMVAAHQARAGWNKTFPGFKAKLVVTIDGVITRGTATIHRDGSVEVDLPTGAAADWAKPALESIASHRFGSAKEHYEVSFADDITTHPMGRLIRFHKSESHSLYRIKDDVITEVHRTMGPMKFTISVTQVQRNPDGKTLPSHFNVSNWNAKNGALESNDDYQDEWIRQGDFDLPKRRLQIHTANGERKVYELVLSGHILMPPEKK